MPERRGRTTNRGVGRGDRVLIYLPMIPEAVFAMFACARIGAIHSVVFGGFAAKELSSRIDDCAPKLILTASCGIEPTRVVQYKPMIDQAIEQATHKVPRVIVLQRPQAVAHRQPHGQQHKGQGQQQVGQYEAPVVGQKGRIRALGLDHPQDPERVVAGVDAVRRSACAGLGDHAHGFGC